MSVAFVFPGQGSQAVGMGREFLEAFPQARYVLEEVNDALGENLQHLILNGPSDLLTLTHNAQPALMAISMAMIQTLESEAGKKCWDLASYMAGHSLGEYTALCATGSFSVQQAARLLRLRGNAMQRAVPVGEGGMAAILGLELNEAEELAQEASALQTVCVVANDNCPGQVVLSGHSAAIEKAIEIAPQRQARRAMALQVSAPFHCSLMAPAAEEMDEALEEIKPQASKKPIISNVTAMPMEHSDDIHRLLVEQVTGRVRWRESLLNLQQLGVTKIVEVGAGKVLTGLVKRTIPEVEALTLNTPDDLENILKSIGG